MPIEFRCTQCERLLRTKDDTAGKQAKCPECGAILTVPSPIGPPPATRFPEPPALQSETDAANPYRAPLATGPALEADADSAYALARVKFPAAALIATAGVGILLQLAFIAFMVFVMLMVGQQDKDNLWPAVFGVSFYIAASVFGIIMGCVVLYGALKMKSLENYTFSLVGAILAMIPCISPCCVITLPFGLWAIIVLSDDNVRRAFTR